MSHFNENEDSDEAKLKLNIQILLKNETTNMQKETTQKTDAKIDQM